MRGAIFVLIVLAFSIIQGVLSLRLADVPHKEITVEKRQVDPCAFNQIFLNNIQYRLSANPISSWGEALDLCRLCLGRDLANISAAIVLATVQNDPFIDELLFIGRYNSGTLVSNLTWFTGTGTIAPVNDGEPRRAICDAPFTPPSPPPTPVCSSNFSTITVGLNFYLSDALLSSWSAAQALCQACFGTDLADIFAPFNIIPGRSFDFIVFIGRYGGGELVPGLVWNMGEGLVNVFNDQVMRRALCQIPVIIATPTPPPSPTPADCTFNQIVLDDTPYRLTTNLLPTWAAALELCRFCLDSDLADISSAIVQSVVENQTLTGYIYIGSYNSGALTPSLNWVTDAGVVVVSPTNFSTFRLALCNEP